jgi:ATP-binding protein involved in chromosome partitioning
MANVTSEQIEEKLKDYTDPYMEKDLVSTHCIKNIAVEGNSVTIDIELGYPHQGYEKELTKSVTDAVSPLDGVDAVNVNVSSKIVTHAVQKGVKPVKGVKNIIAVASGKGGVGKSTTTVNLALALAADGATVGVLDADIYGPSMPRMLGLSGKPSSDDGQSLNPMINHGIQTMSIGFLVEDDTPMIWRGPMVTQALEQLFNDTRWQDVDYLVVDLPPGTGDVQLTLAISIRQLADDGTPTVAAEPEGRITQMYIEMARKVAAKLALKAKDYSNKFPTIVIKND